MRNIFLIFIITFQLFSFDEVEISAVFGDKNGFGRVNNLNLSIGTTGIVIKKLSEKNQAIISYAEVTDSDIFKFYEFDSLKQENLPKGLWKPKAGDIIRFKENYNRAIIIAKNFNSLVRIDKMFKRDWIHPDIFIVALNSKGHKSPLKKDFQDFCKENSIGLIFVELEDYVKKVDCLSLKILESFPFTASANNDIQKPFYSRVEITESNWFGDGKEQIIDFDKYYINLLK